MILSLFKRKASRNSVRAVYGAIVAAARHPRFYAEWGVEDTVDGRYDAYGLLLDPFGDFYFGRRDRLDARERRRHAVVLALTEQKLGRLRVEIRRGQGDGDFCPGAH